MELNLDLFRDLAIAAGWFGALALVVKGRSALSQLREAAGEWRTNAALLSLDALAVAPLLVAAGAWLFGRLGLNPGGTLFPERPSLAGFVLISLAAVFVGDFVGYWRHRLEHCRWLWPAHAVHHSDTRLSWLSLFRFHPLNRLSTYGIDGAALVLIGFPPWAALANGLVRHWYGMFIHADLPWTFGRASILFVSPAMHRWHHVADRALSGKNFATVFSVFDRAFGTYHVPGPCDVPTGVSDAMGEGAIGQLAYPFRARAYRRAG